MFKNGMRPVHPGEILKEEYLEPLGLTAAALACAPTVNDIVLMRRSISADVALRLAVALETSAQFWLNLQTAYDLRTAEIAKGAQIYKEVEKVAHCA